MKYEYQDVILNELLKQIGSEIDEKSLESAVFNVYHFEFGWYKPNKEHSKTNGIDKRNITISEGCILGIHNNNGEEYSIDYSVYEISRTMEEKKHIICHLEIM